MDVLLTGVVPTVGVYYLPSFSLVHLSIFILLAIVYTAALVWYRCGERPDLKKMSAVSVWIIWAIAIFFLMKATPGIGGIVSSIGVVFLIGSLVYSEALSYSTKCSNWTSDGSLRGLASSLFSYIKNKLNPLPST